MNNFASQASTDGRDSRANAELPCVISVLNSTRRSSTHYRSLIAKVPDLLTVERVGELIKEMQAQKAQLHPEQET